MKAGEKYKTVLQGKKDLIINNFLGGISWALGATVGISIVFALLGILFNFIDAVPLVGDFVSEVMEFVSKKNPNLLE